jgi:transposase
MALLFSAPAGFLREIRVKSPAAMRLRALIGGRAQLAGIGIELSYHMRGVMKTFGLVVPNGGGRVFETNVRTLLSGQEALASMVLPLLETGAARCAQAARRDHQLIAVARASAACRLMMTVPGIGPSAIA